MQIEGKQKNIKILLCSKTRDIYFEAFVLESFEAGGQIDQAPQRHLQEYRVARLLNQ